jgi:hypothetical protein
MESFAWLFERSRDHPSSTQEFDDSGLDIVEGADDFDYSIALEVAKNLALITDGCDREFGVALRNIGNEGFVL